MKRRGIFIVFEGVEGSGKSTHAELLARDLKRTGRSVVLTREPGGTEFGLLVRKLLLHGKMTLRAETETLLFMASRSELVEQVIAPALKAGKVVISDRWLDATLAYQGYGSGVDRGWIRDVSKRVTRGVEPDCVIFMDLAAREGLKRARSRSKPDRFESRQLAFHRRVETGYRALARTNRRAHVVPVQSIEETHAAIRRIVDRLI